MKAKTKSKVTCFECGSSYSLDLSGLAPEVVEITCMRCGKKVPILKRIFQAKSEKGEDPARNQAKQAEQDHAFSEAHGYLHDDSEDMGGWASSVQEAGDGPGWIATYGDMMSILLIFFILMFAISSVDRKKFEIVMQSINNALGGTVTFSRLAPSAAPETLAIPPSPLEVFKKEVRTEQDALSKLRRQLEGFIRENQLQDRFSLLDENEGLAILAQDMTMFDLGSAEIRAEVLPSLKKIGNILRMLRNHIVVEGHTDDLPIHSGKFSSNWELSVMRATNVVHYLLTECELDPSRLSAAGYSWYRPRYGTNSSDKVKNRRIEIVIRKRYSDNLVDELLQPN